MLRESRWILLVLALLAITSCEQSDTELRMRTLEHAPASNTDPLRPIFKQKSKLRIVHVDAPGTISGVQLLSDGKVDLALVENSSSFQTGVRAVLPVYKSVMHLLVSDDADFSNPNQPLLNKSVYIVDGSPAGTSFVQMAASRQGLKKDDYKISQKMQPGVTDLVIYFGPINPRDTSWFIPGYHFFSLREDSEETTAMSSEAIAYLLPRMEPKIIPAYTYDLPGNEQNIFTLEVDALLAAHRDLPEDVVYELTKILLERKPWFAAVAPEVFSGITEQFDPLKLSFPLHSGARRYLARDEPSSLERYAETINMLVYLFFLVLTGAVGLARWHARNKKDRIDIFYSRVLAIRVRATQEPHCALLDELQQLELEAFESLISEKLAADESFRIFIELLTRTMNELNPTSTTIND